MGLCGHYVSDERLEAGYTYCTRRECFLQYGRKQLIIAQHVNKSIPAIVRAERKEH